MIGALIAAAGSIVTVVAIPGQQDLGTSILIGVAWGLVGFAVNLATD